jgi:F-type H+-transporting ATPase subunit beta
VQGFRAILDGDTDDIPEPYFYMAGTIEEVKERAAQDEAR